MNGYISLISILVISAVVILVAANANLSSVGEANMGLQENQKWESFYLSEACAEEALDQIYSSVNFEGSGSLLLGAGSCSYAVIRLTGQNRIINASGTVGGIIQKTKVILDTIRPRINVVSWTPVAEF